MKELVYYTDGGCEPNPGDGVWAFVLVEPRIEVTGYEPETTNNRMELIAVIKSIEHGQEMKAEKIAIFSDSQYVVNGFNDWMHGWNAKGWRRKGEQIKNLDLWQRLWQLKDAAILYWVLGHDGNEFNELADELVRAKFTEVTGKKMKF